MKSTRNETLVDPEMEVLLWAVRIDDQNDEALLHLLEDIDWEKLKILALSHHLVPLLYNRLKKLPNRTISLRADSCLKHIYERIIIRNMLQARQLFRIIQELSNRDIIAVPFKGVVLASQAYGTPDMRQSEDIDILIFEKDLPETLKFFLSQDMHPVPPLTRPNAMYSGIKRSITFISDRNFDIDLHWGIFDKFTGFHAGKQFLHDYKKMKLFNFSIPTFSLEDTLILISVHGTKHAWGTLKWIADIVYIIHNNPDLDLDAVLRESEIFHCERIVHSSLHLAQLMGGIVYPAAVQDVLNEDQDAYRIALKFMQFYKNNEMPDIIDHVLILIRSRERWLDAVGFFLFAIVTCPPPKGFHYQLPWVLRPLNFPIQLLWHMYPFKNPGSGCFM